MNIQKLYESLCNALDKLNAGDVDDHARLDLEIMVLQLKKQISIGGFDPLKSIGTVTVADVTKLPALVEEIDTVINDEKVRVALVSRITAIAKIALKASGLPIPS